MLIESGTFSKNPKMFGFSSTLSATEGNGAKVQLNNGTWYTDWISGLGQNLLGYNSPGFNEAVCSQINRGVGFSLTNDIERITADVLAVKLSTHVPGWQGQTLGVRFGKTGTDATTMAVRLARAITGRDLILSCGYHGWGDWSIAATPPAWGIPGYTTKGIQKFDYEDDPNSFPQRVAAVIIEHPAWEIAPLWWRNLRRWCDANNALLILDEVVTGLRYGVGGAAERYQIFPDLVCMGKAMGNGFAISAVVGPKDYMGWFSRNDPVFCSSTTWGNAEGMAAAYFVLTLWNQSKVDYIWRVGETLLAGLRVAGWKVMGHGGRSVVQFEDDYEHAFFIQEMFQNGVLMNRPNLPNLAHTMADVECTSEIASHIRQKWNEVPRAKIESDLEGKLPKVLFRDR